MTKQPPEAAQAATPTSMREKMAREIHQRHRRLYAYVFKEWDALQFFQKSVYLDLADGALDALMEPTDGMLDAAGCDPDRCCAPNVDRAEFISAEREAVRRGFLPVIRAAKEGK